MTTSANTARSPAIIPELVFDLCGVRHYAAEASDCEIKAGRWPQSISVGSCLANFTHAHTTAENELVAMFYRCERTGKTFEIFND